VLANDYEYFIDNVGRSYCGCVVFLSFIGGAGGRPIIHRAPVIDRVTELSVWTDRWRSQNKCMLRSRIWCPAFKEVGRA